MGALSSFKPSPKCSPKIGRKETTARNKSERAAQRSTSCEYEYTRCKSKSKFDYQTTYT
jgi:hypothetical protein